MEITDIFKAKPYRYVFFTVFFLYFIFYQIADRLLIFFNFSAPPGIGIIVTTSPPANPSSMPFPLWGPFLSFNGANFTWALTPLSISISFLISFLVSMNVVMYLLYYSMIRAGAKKTIAGSLGLIATSLSCSCELFTALIGSATASLPFLSSLALIDTLSEGLVALAVFLLMLSSFVLYSEVSGRNVRFSLTPLRKSVLIIALFITSLMLPETVPFTLVKVIFTVIAGGLTSIFFNLRSKFMLLPSITIIVGLLLFYPSFYSSFLIYPLSFSAGFLGNIGFQSMKRWAKLGIMHVIAWTMIMPGPISLVLGYPLPFFNFSPGQLIEMWIFSWIAGTPIAWLAGIYYLRYLKTNMSSFSELRLNVIDSERKGLTWIGLGILALVSQVAFFLTHVQYFTDYNGFDYGFLTTMTSVSTAIMIAGAFSIGYGIYEILSSRFSMPKIRRKDLLIYTVGYAFLVSVLGGVVHFNVSGFSYPTFYLFTFGVPMLDPSILLYIPPFIGIFLNPLEILQVAGVSLVGGYIICILRVSRERKGAYFLGLGAIGVCPACFLSTYVFGFVSLSLGMSALFSLSDQLLVSMSSDALLLASMMYLLKKRACSYEPRVETKF
uniref:FoxF n=1 Tax=Sulfuracidifex metallicus TaxID=47303 RepID=A4ZGV1_SULME|nr:FoxF [Sulfuracidifex metallicus DSM 6482 = JCM 9184]